MADVERDDGAEKETAFEIEAAQGTRVVTFNIPAARFGAMNWPTEHLDAEAIVYPGTTVKDHARVAVQMLSPKPIPRRTIYTHTGWRKIGDGWAYLHAGGAIGASGKVAGVQVELPATLALYELPDPPQGDVLKAAIRATLARLYLASDAIAVPGFAAAFRAAMGRCDFGFHLAGATGVFKTEDAALIQQHFGSGLDARHLPGSWHSTDNALEGLLFAAKDAVTVVDDFAPCGGPHDVARWHQRADRVIRAQGNNLGRGRMRADGSLRPPKPPRGMVVSTGEDIPKGQSLRARMLVLEISKGDIAQDVLTRCQKDARSGLYADTMAGFVRYLASRYDQVWKSLRDEVEILRQKAVESDAHCRTAEIIANLAIGLRYFIAFAQDAKAMTEAEGQALWDRGWAALRQVGRQQADQLIANEPTRRFIELLTNALASGQAHLADPHGNAPTNASAWGWRHNSGPGSYIHNDWQPHGDRIGWLDGSHVLLDPDASYRAAQSMAAGGDGLSISARTLRKRLDEKGMLIREGQKDTLTVRRVLEGNMRNVLHLAGTLLYAQSDISDTPDSNPSGGAENPDECQIPMSENPAETSRSLTLKPGNLTLGPPQGPENGGDGGNVRNSRKGPDIPPTNNTVHTQPRKAVMTL